MALTPEDIERRIAAKRNNERVKLWAGAFNNLSILSLFGSVILPIIKQEVLPILSILSALLFFLVFQFAAQAVISFMRSEDYMRCSDE